MALSQVKVNWRFPKIGYPKSSILTGFSILITKQSSYGGTSILGNHQIYPDLSRFMFDCCQVFSFENSFCSTSTGLCLQSENQVQWFITGVPIQSVALIWGSYNLYIYIYTYCTLTYIPLLIRHKIMIY